MAGPGTIDLEKGLAVFRSRLGEAETAHLSACVHCGLCADSCHYHRMDPCLENIPAHKLELVAQVFRRHCTALGRLGLAGREAAKSLRGLGLSAGDEARRQDDAADERVRRPRGRRPRQEVGGDRVVGLEEVVHLLGDRPARDVRGAEGKDRLPEGDHRRHLLPRRLDAAEGVPEGGGDVGPRAHAGESTRG